MRDCWLCVCALVRLYLYVCLCLWLCVQNFCVLLLCMSVGTCFSMLTHSKDSPCVLYGSCYSVPFREFLKAFQHSRNYSNEDAPASPPVDVNKALIFSLKSLPLLHVSYRMLLKLCSLSCYCNYFFSPRGNLLLICNYYYYCYLVCCIIFSRIFRIGKRGRLMFWSGANMKMMKKEKKKGWTCVCLCVFSVRMRVWRRFVCKLLLVCKFVCVCMFFACEF